MIRKILCACCKHAYRLTDRDVADGMAERRTIIFNLKRPENLTVKVTTVDQVRYVPCPELACDLCGQKLIDGAKAMAVTQWRGLGPEPEKWEHTYEQPTRVELN